MQGVRDRVFQRIRPQGQLISARCETYGNTKRERLIRWLGGGGRGGNAWHNSYRAFRAKSYSSPKGSTARGRVTKPKRSVININRCRAPVLLPPRSFAPPPSLPFPPILMCRSLPDSARSRSTTDSPEVPEDSSTRDSVRKAGVVQLGSFFFFFFSPFSRSLIRPLPFRASLCLRCARSLFAPRVLVRSGRAIDPLFRRPAE